MTGEQTHGRFLAVWEFQVSAEHRPEFCRIYGSHGEWSELFERAEGYLGTELVQDRSTPGRFLTLDRWHSEAAYESFRIAFAENYRTLDDRCAGLTETEKCLGNFDDAG